MSDPYERVRQDENPLEVLARKIPGFSGYIERKNRRNADKLLRETIANRMAEQWRRLTEIQRTIAQSGDIRLLDDLEAAAVRLRTFVDQVRTASYGYAGFFDAVKINEAELGQLYAYDLTLLDLVDEVARAIDHLEASLETEGLPAALRNLMQVARRCVETFHRREEIFIGSPSQDAPASSAPNPPTD